jgi:thiamine-phosphate pyrophosphorylase
MAKLPDRRPLLYYITDRMALPGADPLPVIKGAVAAGVDLVQIRERALTTRALLVLLERAAALAAASCTLVLVNDRLDLAQLCGLGLHLPAHSFPVRVVRERVGPDLLIGASTHNLDELRAAEQGGADFAVFGPVFPTASKPGGQPLGLQALAEAVRAVRLPVLALGGVTLENAADCLRAGAAGWAGISLFQAAADLPAVVRALRTLAGESQA